MLQSGGQNRKWRTNGQTDYITPAILGVPNTLQCTIKSKLAQNGRISRPLMSEGSRTLQSGEQNQKWPANGRIKYITTAVRGGGVTIA